MKFRQYLTEGRSKVINEDDAKRLLKKHCKKALKAYSITDHIYRGVEGMYSPYAYINPKKGDPRRSANTANYYTHILDNSPDWKKYPKRSQSIICTTSSIGSKGYGNSYLVFPYDGAKIGVCPEGDFWYSFYKSGINYMSDFNRNIHYIMHLLAISINDRSFRAIKDAFEEFDDVIESQGFDIDLIIKKVPWLKYYDGSLMGHINDILDPASNKFKLINIGQRIGCNDCEVWTDSQSIMVLSNDDDALIDNMVKELGF